MKVSTLGKREVLYFGKFCRLVVIVLLEAFLEKCLKT